MPFSFYPFYLLRPNNLGYTWLIDELNQALTYTYDIYVIVLMVFCYC